jgi:hypothetical protein
MSKSTPGVVIIFPGALEVNPMPLRHFSRIFPAYTIGTIIASNALADSSSALRAAT